MSSSPTSSVVDPLSLPDVRGHFGVDRKSLFRRLGRSPRKVVLESGFTVKGVVKNGFIVKVAGLPLRGMPRTDRHDHLMDKTGLI